MKTIDEFECPDCDTTIQDKNIINSLSYDKYGDAVCPNCGGIGHVTKIS